MFGLNGEHQQDPDSQVNHAKSSRACHMILNGCYACSHMAF